MEGTGPIRTPDQRLRVFVSSTLKELAAERRAARGAIEKLRLAPVMFELGARPHPPRELYRAYLQQSDVFVGLYWEKYGWVAPEEQVSGLEDEYTLAPAGMPRLMYIKETSRERETRLAALLDRIRADDNASFKYFTDAEELADLLEQDLAILLAERFDRSRAAPHSSPDAPHVRRPSAIPAPLTQLIGREQEVAEIRSMLHSASVRMVTLVGPGGIGKSRLAIDVAAGTTADFPGGVVFVPLAPIDQAPLVANAIAQALGVRDPGDVPLEDKLVIALRHRRTLLVLDNFEQVLGAAPLIVSLLGAAPQLKVLITSRALLRVSGENSFEVGPLGLPSRRRSRELPASVALFVERARAVKPDFELTPDNIDVVERICVALEGVPLALELAAARVRMMSPASLLQRLDRQLSLLVGGQRDLPPRLQALRSTIEWSTQLLTQDAKELLFALGIFSGRFSLEAVESLADDPTGIDVLVPLSALVDNSLVRQQERDGRTYFALLATVREYAMEQLEARGTVQELRGRHAAFYAALAVRMDPELKGSGQAAAIARLADERDNLRAAARYLLDQHRWDDAAEFAWHLFVYWWIGGQLGEVKSWMDEILTAGEGFGRRTQASAISQAIALFFTNAITYWQHPGETIVPGLTQSAALFREEGDKIGEGFAMVSRGLARLSSLPPDPVGAREDTEASLQVFRQVGEEWGEVLALVTLGRVDLLEGKTDDALEHLTESLRLSRERRDGFSTTVAQHHLGWAYISKGMIDEAEAELQDSLEYTARVRHHEGSAYALEGLLGVAAARGEYERAGLMYGASEMLREQVGMYNPVAFAFDRRLVEQLRSGVMRNAFERGYAAGRMLAPEEAIAYALPQASTVGGGVL
jgi:predicted ATPase